MEQKILTKNQENFLNIFAGEKSLASNFYLSGGTTLSAFYLFHRFSEDLDFFCEKEFDSQTVTVFLKKYKNLIRYKKFDYQQSFNRNLFFLRFDRQILKTEFTYFPFKQIDSSKIVNGIKVDSEIDIAVNKVFSISQNSRTRDFIDLFFLIKKNKFNFESLLNKARIKFDWYIDPLNLGAQLMKVKNIKDYPKMIKKINDKEWQDYFLGLAKKIGKKI